MNDLLRTQQDWMEGEWVPSPWLDRSTLTPWADYAWHASLVSCRERLPADLSAHSFLIVNCGAGVDTHYIQFEGAERITTTDISARALAITRDHCPGVRGVIADTERLPFADASFDFVGVRSGLHHLSDPFNGIDEMARVARRGFFFVENQKTPLVPLLVKLGFLEHEEDAGNTVHRFTREEIGEHFRDLGITRFDIETAWFLQLPPLLELSKRVPGKLPAFAFRTLIKLINIPFGRLGNAFCVVAFKE